MRIHQDHGGRRGRGRGGVPERLVTDDGDPPLTRYERIVFTIAR